MIIALLHLTVWYFILGLVTYCVILFASVLQDDEKGIWEDNPYLVAATCICFWWVFIIASIGWSLCTFFRFLVWRVNEYVNPNRTTE